MTDNDHLRTFPSSGLPIAGAFASQAPSALYWFGRFLEEMKPQTIIEFGTGEGALTCYMGLWCSSIFTFDISPNLLRDWTKDLGFRLGIAFFQGDDGNVFDPKVRQLVQRHAGDKLFLFCDGGDKKREFETYRPLLKAGDAVAVHDCGTEFNPADVDLSGLEPWHLDEMAADGARLGVWKVL